MQRVKIAIDTKTMIRFWLVVIGFALAALLLHKAQQGLIIIGISIFMAVALNTPVSRLAHKMPGRSRSAATAISYVAIVVLLGTIITLVVPPILEQTAKFTSAVPTIVDGLVNQWGALRDVLSKYGLEQSLDDALSSLQTMAAHFASNVGKMAIGSIGSLMEFITALILVLVLTFLFLMDGPSIMKKYYANIQNTEKRQQQERIFNKIYDVITGYVNGQLIVSAIGAFAAGTMTFILSLIFTDIPSNLAAPVAVITFTLSLIPMFGAAIAGTITALIMAMNSFPAAVIYIIFFIIYQQIENNFIQPVVQGKRIALSPLVILISITLGVYMYGIVGGVIAIPVAGTIQVLLEEYTKQKQATAASKAKKDKPVAKFAKKVTTKSTKKVTKS